MGAIYCCTLLQPPLQDMVDAVSMVDGAKSAIDLFGGIYLAEGGRMEGEYIYMHLGGYIYVYAFAFAHIVLASPTKLHHFPAGQY